MIHKANVLELGGSHLFCCVHSVIHQIQYSHLVEWMERYHLDTGQGVCNRLQEEIADRLFPPCIQLRLTYDRDPTMWTSRQNVVLVVNSLLPHTEPITFPLQVKIPDNTFPLQVKIPGNGKRATYSNIVMHMYGKSDYHLMMS